VKGTVLAVETGPATRRAALVRDGVLEGVEIDRLDETRPLPGAIYRCRITGLVPGIGAATADMGGGVTGFFPDATGLTAGQSLLVEVRREAEGEKAARLSPALQLRSAHLVLTPARPGINVSRKITDPAQRTRLHAAITPCAPHGGFVIRTEAADIPTETLQAEAAALTKRLAALAADPTPGLRAPAADAVTRLLKRAGRIDSILADDPALPTLPADPAPRHDPAPFETLDLDAALAALLSPRHDLTEGWVSVDPTPALVAVDVNTGTAAGGNAALRVNLDAARTIPRLLSLRKLGGLVVVDFAGTPTPDERHRLHTAFRQAAADYLEGASVFGWGPAGLLEAVCRRPGRPLALLLSEDVR